MSYVFFIAVYSTFVSVTRAELPPVGCYSNQPPTDDVMSLGYQQGTSINIQGCSAFCRRKGHAYSGLKAGSACYCGDEFGLTNAVITCNFTCGGQQCGGLNAYSVHYVIDSTKEDKRKFYFGPDTKGFYEARQACVKQDGDLVGRKIKDAAMMERLKNLVPSANNASTKVWIGLRKRHLAYEWIDEKEPSASDTYVKLAFEYSSMWTPNDPGKKCVSYDVISGELSSFDCDASLTSVCTFYNDTTADTSSIKTLTQDTDGGEDKKTLALFIVLPLFLICYGGACILYCVHKIMKHCCKKSAHSQNVKLIPSRPKSAKKNAIYPAPDMPSQTTPMMLPMTAAEEKKLKLLDNALREAKERRDAEMGIPDSRPVSTKYNGMLLPSMSAQRATEPIVAAVPSGGSGMSINDILRNKMEQQANKKKPKRIIAT